MRLNFPTLGSRIRQAVRQQDDGPGQRTLFTKLVQCLFEAAPEVRAPPGGKVVEDRVELFDVVLVDARGRQHELRDVVEGDQTQSRVGVERRGERPRRVLAHVQNGEAVLLRLAGRVLYFALGRHRAGDVEDDHDLDCRLRGRRVALDLDEGGVFDALHHPQGEAVLFWGGGQLAAEQRRRVRRRRWAGQREYSLGQSW